MSYIGLCVGAAGINGILQLGALHEFYTKGYLNNISYYAGSSAGSLTVSLLALGYSPMELLTTQCESGFSNQFSQINIMNLSSILGFYPESTLRKKIEELMILKIGYLPTFLDMKKTGKYIIIPAYCLGYVDCSRSLGKDEHYVWFSPDSTPNIKIVDAIILSCAIPIIFQQAIYDERIYIDGAFTSVFPIHELLDIIPESSLGTCRVLGLHMKREEHNIRSLINYVISILSIAVKNSDLGSIPSYVDIIELQILYIPEEKSRMDINRGSPPNIQDSQDYYGLNLNVTTVDKIQMFIKGGNQCRDIVKRYGERMEKKK